MYAEHFGLSKLPFSVTPDAQLFFSNSLYRDVFAKLQYGVAAKKGFVVITGEVGTGKTTLLRRLLHGLGPAVHSVFIFNTQVNFLELLRLILEDLNLPASGDDKVAMIETLNGYLIERLRQSHIVTLLIDEAQNLGDEALEGLRLLSNLESDTDKLLQIVLMGQPELELKLDQPKLRQLKQRITLHCRLRPLKQDEVGAYIEFRLKGAGFRGKRLFDEAAVAAIAVYSRGIPRLINVICDNALLSAFGASKRQVSADLVEQVARDLQIDTRQPMWPKAAEHNRPPARTVRPRKEKENTLDFEKVLAGARPGRWHVMEGKHRAAGFAIGVFLTAVALGGVGISYTRQNKIDLSSLAENWQDVSAESRQVFSGWTAKGREISGVVATYAAQAATSAQEVSRESKTYLSENAARISDESADYAARFVQRAKDSWGKTAAYLSSLVEQTKAFALKSRAFAADLARRMGETVRSQWNSSKDLISSLPAKSGWRSAELGMADSEEVKPSKPVGPPAISKHEPEAKNSTEKRIAKGAPAEADGRAGPSAVIARPGESGGSASRKAQAAAPASAGETQARYAGKFEVVANSFVRDRPSSDAKIITTLEPGRMIRVESKEGKYFRVRSLDDSGIRGYVHEEDAFFERVK